MRYKARAMHEITMTLLSGPGRPMGDPARRIRIRLALDPHGGPSAEAWLADPEPWPAWLDAPDAPDRRGDLQHDADFGWHLRMPEGGHALDDASLWAIGFPGIIRPGETVHTSGPDGEDWAWRIVAVEAVG
jgi:hypothetical protein